MMMEGNGQMAAAWANAGERIENSPQRGTQHMVEHGLSPLSPKLALDR